MSTSNPRQRVTRKPEPGNRKKLQKQRAPFARAPRLAASRRRARRFRRAGLPAPAYGFVGRGSEVQRTQYLEAVRNGYLGNYDDLADFFAEAVERRRQARRPR